MGLPRNPMGCEQSMDEGDSSTFCFLDMRDGVMGGREEENEHFLVPAVCQPPL